jgi:drug/metabolite transporter (DMT)-like permease
MIQRASGWLPTLVAVAVVVLWGASPVFTKLATAELDPLLIGLARTVLGGLAALPLAAALRSGPPPRRLLLPFALSAFGGFIAFPVLFSFGQRLTSAMHGGLILAALPIFTGLYAAAIERRAPSGRWWLGCAVAFAGEIVLIGARAAAAGGAGSLAGDLLVLAAALFASLGYVAGARLAQAGYASLGATLWGIMAASLVVAPGLAVVSGGALPAASWVAWAALGYLALVVSILGYVGWYWSLGRGGIARMGTIQFLQPLSGLALAFLLLGERPTATLAIATVLILAGVVIARRR